MQLQPLPQLLVDGLDQLHAALHPQSVGQGGLKGLRRAFYEKVIRNVEMGDDNYLILLAHGG